jgi:hypothetical protein
MQARRAVEVPSSNTARFVYPGPGRKPDQSGRCYETFVWLFYAAPIDRPSRKFTAGFPFRSSMKMWTFPALPTGSSRGSAAKGVARG